LKKVGDGDKFEDLEEELVGEVGQFIGFLFEADALAFDGRANFHRDG
jgi:hypothetical protein